MVKKTFRYPSKALLDEVHPELRQKAGILCKRQKDIAQFFTVMQTLSSRGLGERKTNETFVKLVAPYLQHRAEFKRELAAKTLGQIGHPDAIPYLHDAIGDKNYGVRAAVAKARPIERSVIQNRGGRRFGKRRR